MTRMQKARTFAIVVLILTCVALAGLVYDLRGWV